MNRKIIVIALLTFLSVAVYAQKNRYGMVIKKTEDGCTIERQDEVEKLIDLTKLSNLCEPYKYVSKKITAQDYANCTTKSFVYKEYQDYKLEMEVDIPNEGKGPFPFIIYLHGGGWANGSLSSFAEQSKYMASRGIAGVRIAYTLKKRKGHFDQGMEEVNAALAFIKQHTTAWNFDLTRFGYAGGSAGTPLGALAAVKNGAQLFIGANGIYDFANKTYAGSFPGKSNSYLRNYTTPDKLKEISAFHHIPSKNPPAVIVFHGTADVTIPYQQAVAFSEAIRAKGGRSEAKIYPNYMHSFYAKSSSDKFEEITIEMYKFANEVFYKNNKQ